MNELPNPYRRNRGDEPQAASVEEQTDCIREETLAALTPEQKAEIVRIARSEATTRLEEAEYLNELASHVEDLRILKVVASRAAYGTGRRDEETGFLNNGCGKECCTKKYENSDKRLQAAAAFLQDRIEVVVARRRNFAKKNPIADGVVKKLLGVDISIVDLLRRPEPAALGL